MNKTRNIRSRLTLLGASLALAAAASGQVSITTADGTNGADASLQNDGNRAANFAAGAESIHTRYFPGTRMKVGILRFDVSSLAPSSDNSGATLSFEQVFGGTRDRPWRVYGLRDGHSETVYNPATGTEITVDELWAEGTMCYNIAPGIIDSDADPLNGKGLNNGADILTTLDIYDASTNPDGAWELVGNVDDGDGTGYPLPGTGGGPLAMPLIDLGPFVDADTNGYVTFLVFATGPDNTFDLASKETGATEASYPTLILPNATAGDDDLDGLPNDWEIANGLDPNDDGSTDPDNGASGDPDGDGVLNIDEFSATPSSDPQDIASVPGDVDGDGLADIWEDANFGDNSGTVELADLLAQDGAGDPDNDKGTNEQEETAGTDPRIVNELGDPIDGRASFLDDDGGAPDGLNDWWEIFYFGDTTTATSADGDVDGDGQFTEAGEYAGFSNPNDVDSIPGDIDGDDTLDVWESRWYGDGRALVQDTTNGLAQLAFTDGTTDADGDGLTDAQESYGLPVGSDPDDANSVPGDMDADGLDDDWELTHFKIFDDARNDETILRAQNGDDDIDGDLNTNEEEETAGTDPNDYEDFIDVDNGGSGDGLNDAWEILYFGSTDVTDDPDGDVDGDGETNFDEYLDGSDPNDINSTFEDIDGDGLLDDYELTYYESFWDIGPSEDRDLDYATVAEEEVAVTDPTLRDDSPNDDPDALGDGWEVFSFGDTTTTDDNGERDAVTNAIISGDPDGDGFINSEEYAAGSNGNDPLSTPDTDNDGLSDGWELANFILDGEDPVADAATILARQNGQGDPDGGGTINRLEQLNGTNPNLGGDDIAPAIVTTAAGDGADTTLTNDNQSAGPFLPGTVHGTEAGLTARYNADARQRITLLRFDTKVLGGDLSNMMLRIFVNGAPATRVLPVYALVDGDSQANWDEATTSYSTGVGLITSRLDELNQFARDAKRLRQIGTISVTAGVTGFYYTDPRTMDLQTVAEANADSDGLLTLAIAGPHTPTTQTDNNSFTFDSKESGDGSQAPALIAPVGMIADTDVDGLPDDWELTYYEPVETYGPGDDPDMDTATMAEEYAAGTNPLDGLSFPDADADGLSDPWEVANGLDPADNGTVGESSAGAMDGPNGGIGDKDNDGFTNVEEFYAGTDPDDNGSKPVVEPATRTHYYTFNGGTFSDLQGNLDGTLGGSATIENGALVLNQAGDLGNLDAAALAINTYDSISLEFWATPSSAANTGFNSLFVARDTSAIDPNFAANYLLVQTSQPDDISRVSIATNNINSGTPWTAEDGVNGTEFIDNAEHHYVVVVNHTTRQLEYYTDGALVGKTPTLQTLADVGIAVAQVGTGYPADPTWQGTVNEFSIYAGALTPDQIAANFAAKPSTDVPEPALDAWITGVQLSGNQFTMTVTGLANGAPYHVQAGTTGSDFGAIGATFNPDSDPYDVTLTVDPDAVPTQLFRISDGEVPAE